MRASFKKTSSLTMHLLLIVALGLAATFASYLIVTGRNVRLGNQAIVTITGEEIVELPCAPAIATNWQSNDPILPETRGLPFNYHYWNPCDGNQILRKGFLLDWSFWTAISGGSYFIYLVYHRRISKFVR